MLHTFESIKLNVYWTWIHSQFVPSSCFLLQYKEAEGSSFRDNPYETPGTPKVSCLAYVSIPCTIYNYMLAIVLLFRWVLLLYFTNSFVMVWIRIACLFPTPWVTEVMHQVELKLVVLHHVVSYLVWVFYAVSESWSVFVFVLFCIFQGKGLVKGTRNAR